MPKTRRAIVLVPSFRKREQLAARDQLAEALKYYGEGYRLTLSDAQVQQGLNRRHISGHALADPSEELEIDLYEAYWGDLVPDWSEESPWQRFKRGTVLILYWAVLGLARVFARRELPARTSLTIWAASAVLLFWYLTVAVVLAQALPEGSSGMPKQWQALLTGNPLGAKLLAFLTWLGGNAVYLFILLLFGMGFIENTANLAAYLKAYLRDDALEKDGPGMAAKARDRLRKVLYQLHDHGSDGDGKTPYDEIYVVAHSLGGVIAVDALAEYGKGLEKTTLFTWGSTLGFLAEQEPLVEAEIGKLYAAEPPLQNWVDVVFRQDLLGSKVPVPRQAPESWSNRRHEPRFPPTQQPPLPKGVWLELGKVHEKYYRSDQTVLMLLRPASQIPQPLEVTPSSGQAAQPVAS